jgi:hypothetical protein
MSEEKYQGMVYQCPGPYSRAGGTYNTKGVNSKAEHEAARKEGWFDTMPEAIAGKSAVVDVPADNKPPTRAELEHKAKELNIKFDKKVTDKDLADKITAALGV